jgi:hypothetical protein
MPEPKALHRPLLLLAVTLVELAMGSNIEVNIDGDLVKEYVIKSQGSAQPWSEERLLREVRNRLRSAHYRGAVKRCLELDRKMQRRGQRVENIELWIETVLTPLANYSVILRNRLI